MIGRMIDKMSKMEAQIKKLDLHPPYDCPHYFSNWNCDDSCKLTDGDYCSYDEFLGCPEYNEIFGILMPEEFE